MPIESTSKPYDRERLWELAFRYFDGLADEREVAWLEALLAADAGARRDFVTCGFVHGRAPFAVEAVAHGISLASVFPEIAVVDARGWWQSLRRRWPAAAVLLAAVLGAAALGGWRGGGRPALATVTQSRLLVVDDDAAPLEVGQALDAGRLAIRAGVVVLTIRNGVTLVLQGPGELNLVDEMRAFLHEGNAVVRVPKGMSGFRLDTASADVLDLGTEFAVQAGSGLVTEVQVFDGAVIATGKDARSGEQFPKRVKAGEAIRFSPHASGGFETIPYSQSRFVRNLPSEPGSDHLLWREWQQNRKERLYFGAAKYDSIGVARARGPVVIDADLVEWSHARGFAATLRDDPACDERVDGRMMYDADCLYIAAHVRDPFPMRNTIDPALDAMTAWQGGSVEVRISADRAMGWPADANGPAYYRARFLEPSAEARSKAENPRLSHLAMLYHAPSGRASLVLRHGMTFSDDIIDPEGFRGAFARDPDGRGYVMEYAIPWELLNAADDPPQSGDVLAAIWQVHWSDATGGIARDQVVEIRNPHELHRIVPFERAAAWGRAEFE